MEIAAAMNELREYLSAEARELEILGRVVSETHLSVIREYAGQKFHLDNAQIESFVQSRKRFAVAVILFGRGESGTDVAASKGLAWEFAPAEPQSSSEDQLVYMYKETELRMSQPHLNVYLRGILNPDNTADVAVEGRCFEAMQFSEPYTLLSGAELFPSTAGKEVLMHLRERLINAEALFRETTGISYHIGCLAGAWDIDGSEPATWLCDLDEVRGIFTASTPAGDLQMYHRVEEIRRLGLRGSTDVLQIQHLFLTRREASLLDSQERVRELRDHLNTTSPSIARGEIAELDGILSEVERDVRGELPTLRKVKLSLERTLRHEDAVASTPDPRKALRTKLEGMREGRRR